MDRSIAVLEGEGGGQVSLPFGNPVPAGTTVDQSRHAFDAMPIPYMTVDSELHITYANVAAEVTFGIHGANDTRLAEILVSDAALRSDEGATVVERFHHALECRMATTLEHYCVPIGTWYEIHVWPDGHGLSAVFVDIEGRQGIERARVDALHDAATANGRLALLADLSSMLAGASTRSQVMERTAYAIASGVAEWCAIEEPDGDSLVRVAAAHRIPALDALARRLVGVYPHRLTGPPSPSVEVYRRGEPLLLDFLTPQVADGPDDGVSSTAYVRTLRLLGDGPGLIVPVWSEGVITAVITSVRSRDEPFSAEDVECMEEVAAQVAVALSSTRNADNHRRTAAALQAASLPHSLPVSDRLRLAATYRAASLGNQVGGDWYDAVEMGDDRLTLVVGDAAGHGLKAAALMAQMRNVLRANLHNGLGPAGSLRQLCSLLRKDEPDVFATVVCVELELRTGTVIWSSAGHPAPVLVRADGTSVYLPGRGAPPVGWPFLRSATAGLEHRMVLEPGDRLLLYTDGLVERRGSDLEVGIANLMLLAEQTRSMEDAADACECILEELLQGSHEDDVCLLIADYSGAAPSLLTG